MKLIALNKLILMGLMGIGLTSCFSLPGEKSSQGATAPVTATTPVKWSTAAFAGGGLDFKIAEDIQNSFVPVDLDGSGRDPVEQMMKEWNDSTTAFDFFRVTATQATSRDENSISAYLNDGEFGIYRDGTWMSGVSSSALAVTAYKAVHRNAGTPAHHLEIIHADIVMNYRDYSFTTDSSDNSTYDFHSVVLHELGHAIGLKHVDNFSINSVMQPFLSRSDVQRAPTAYDVTTMRNLYGLSALVGGSGFVVGSQTKATSFELPADARESNDGTVIGLIELRADGDCVHTLDGKEVHRHRHNLHKH